MKLYRIGFKRVYALDKDSAEDALDALAVDGEIDDYQYFSSETSALFDYRLTKNNLNGPIVTDGRVKCYEGLTFETTEFVIENETLEGTLRIFEKIEEMPYFVLKKYIKS